MPAVYRSAAVIPLEPGPPVAVTSTPRDSTSPRRSANVTGQVGDPARKWSMGTCRVMQRNALLPGQARTGAGVAARAGVPLAGGPVTAAPRAGASAAAAPAVRPPTCGATPKAPPAAAPPATRASTTASTPAARAEPRPARRGRRPRRGNAVSTAHGRTGRGYGTCGTGDSPESIPAAPSGAGAGSPSWPAASRT